MHVPEWLFVDLVPSPSRGACAHCLLLKQILGFDSSFREWKLGFKAAVPLITSASPEDKQHLQTVPPPLKCSCTNLCTSLSFLHGCKPLSSWHKENAGAGRAHQRGEQSSHPTNPRAHTKLLWPSCLLLRSMCSCWHVPVKTNRCSNRSRGLWGRRECLYDHVRCKECTKLLVIRTTLLP